MSYEVLARKWRPRRFEDLVGQEHVVRALVNALDNDRLHHAFLFTGTRGVGKTTIARILAKSLNCEQGVSARPCGECTTCREVDEGRFVDLIEVDAASRTKVDDTRELLDNVQYAPTRGRYKVYLIDEVHMLSGHSFNALLKTLEEPPPHVKFLLATTDPQKLPVTVLSRCLQFNLKRLDTTQIAAQLEKILEQEQVGFDQPSLALLARAADGSMRDGLSLLDQAIAFGGGKVEEGELREMLGSIDPRNVERLLQALATNDAGQLLAVVAEMSAHAVDYAAVLDALLFDLHRVALAQVDPALGGDDDLERRRIAAHAAAMSAEDVQLFYQIGLYGKRDLPLAPDPRNGLEMALLRMVAFRPADAQAVPAAAVPSTSTSGRVPPPPETATSPARGRAEATPAARTPEPGARQVAPSPAQTAPPLTTSGTDEGWSSIVARLEVGGLLRQLVNHSVLESRDGDHFTVVLDESCAQLYNKERETALTEALAAVLGRSVRLSVRLGQPDGETPAAEQRRVESERQEAAEAAIANDPTVRALQENFNARVKPESIRSRQ